MADTERIRNGISVRGVRKKNGTYRTTRESKRAPSSSTQASTHDCSFSVPCVPVSKRDTVKRFNTLLTPVTTMTMTSPTQSLNRTDPRRPHLQPVPKLPRGRQPPNRFRTGKGRCAADLVRWHQASDPSCICGNPRQTMDHVINHCAIARFLVVCGHYIKPMKTMFHGWASKASVSRTVSYVSVARFHTMYWK